MPGRARFVLLTGLPPAHPGYPAVDAVPTEPVGPVALRGCVQRLPDGGVR